MTAETILLVEDNDAVALGLEHVLLREGFKVIRAATAAKARHLAASEEFDLIVLDIRLPDGNGFDLCREFRSNGFVQPILMLTARDEIIDKVIGLELGADDYMTKPFELRELVARLRSMSRRAYGSLSGHKEARINVGDLILDLPGQRVRKGGEELTLTPTEFKLLHYLAINAGKPLDREALLQHIWGTNSDFKPSRLIDVHMRNLRQKIEENPAEPKRLKTVRGIGYMLAPDED